MKKKLKLLGLALALSMTAAIGTATSAPIIIDVNGVTCIIDGQNQTHYIYQCSDGSLYYLPKNSGGSGGGGGGGDEDDCSPHAIFC